MPRSFPILLGLLLALPALAEPAALAPAGYTISDLGVFERGTASAALAINNLGEIAGWAAYRGADLNPLPTSAVLWKGTSMQELVDREKHPLPAAFAINDSGAVLIHSEPQAAPGHALDIAVPSYTVLWRDAKTTDLLSFPAGGLNKNAEVVGYGSPPGKSEIVAAVWKDGRVRFLDTLPGDRSSLGTAINDAGHVAGTSTSAKNEARPFFWDGKKMVALGKPAGCTQAQGARLSNRDQVLVWGWSGDPNKETQQSFLWEKGQYRQLGLHDPNGRIAYALNDAGQVVGNDGKGPFLWSPGKLVHLQELLPPNSGWKLQSANDINEHGQIVGWGEHDGWQRGFVLTPRLPAAP